MQNKETVTLFYTEIFPTELKWINNESIKIKTEEENIEYNTIDRKQKVIDNYEDYSCTTEIFNIHNPEEIATRIQIFNNENNKEINMFETSLTLDTIVCNPEILLLTPAIPLIQNKVYVWKDDNKEPFPLNIHLDLGVTITKTKFNQEVMLAGIYTSEQTLLKYDLNNDTYIEFENIPELWAITNRGDIVSIEQNGNASTIISNTEGIICTTESETNFIDIIPSSDIHTYALISDIGELWILNYQ